MKELSIEEKAKAYDEAKLRMSAAYNSNRCTIGFMNEIFPELKESEDERIRQLLIRFVKYDMSDNYSDDFTPADCVAWLEKQGKNNMGISEATKQELEVNLNKALEKETPESFNEFLEKQGWKKTYASETMNEKEGFDSGFTRMMEKEQKPAWSEEDEKCIDELIKFFDSMKDCLAVEERHQENRRWLKFLKSLKGANTTQLTQEWSIEDTIRLQEAIRIVQNYHNSIKDEHLFAASGWCLGWLKSLKDRCLSHPQS